MARRARVMPRLARAVNAPFLWGAVVAIGGPGLLLLSIIAFFNTPGTLPYVPWKVGGGLLIWLLPGMAAIAGAESDSAVRRRIAAATAVTTAIVITIYGLMITTHVACQPVSRVEALPTVLTLSVPAGVITWALMRIGGALTVRFGWIGVLAAILLGAAATTAVIFWWAVFGLLRGPPGY